MGLYGRDGAGLMDQIGQRARATIVSGTLGKGFGVTGKKRGAWRHCRSSLRLLDRRRIHYVVGVDC